MKIKPSLVCAGALLLAAALLRFGPGGPSPAASGEAPARTSAFPALPSARTLASPNRLPAAVPILPRREPGSLVGDLLAWLGRCDPAQRPAEIQRWVADQDLVGLQEMLEDEIAVLTLPEDVMQAMLRRLARDDARWTADYLPMLPDDSFRIELIATTMTAWRSTDLPAALAWAQALGDPALQDTALVHLGERWYETDPAAALAFAAAHPAAHPQLLARLVDRWSREQPAAAAAWVAATLAHEPEMSEIAAAAVAAWAKKDELAAAEFVLQLPAGRQQEESAISVMLVLARKDPDLGTAWTTVFPVGPNRDYAIENLAGIWAGSDSASALAWAERLPAKERNAAAFGGAEGLIETNPAMAITWAMRIQNESMRLQQAGRAARQWLDVDPPAARQWILTSALPDSQKQALLQPTGS